MKSDPSILAVLHTRLLFVDFMTHLYYVDSTAYFKVHGSSYGPTLIGCIVD